MTFETKTRTAQGVAPATLSKLDHDRRAAVKGINLKKLEADKAAAEKVVAENKEKGKSKAKRRVLCHICGHPNCYLSYDVED